MGLEPVELAAIAALVEGGRLALDDTCHCHLGASLHAASAQFGAHKRQGLGQRLPDLTPDAHLAVRMTAHSALFISQNWAFASLI